MKISQIQQGYRKLIIYTLHEKDIISDFMQQTLQWGPPGTHILNEPGYLYRFFNLN